jgi:histone deacetylase 1/2
MQSGGQGSQSSANYGGRSGSHNNRGGGGGRGRGRGGNRGAYNNNTHSNSASNNNSTINAGGNDMKQRCQLCFKPGHTVITCWHRFDADFVPDTNRSAAAASASQGGGDSIWYTDTGATDHITGELDKLAVHERYNGTDQIRTASGAGMDINRIGHSVIHTPSRDLHLKNILHAPQPPKILFPSIV